MKLHFQTFASVFSFLLVLNAAAVTRFVNLNSPNPTPPYTNWITAATNIQGAIDAAVAGDLILVTNGVYRTGGGVSVDGRTNRVVLTNSLLLLSVNGASDTIIDGDGVMRCAYLADGAELKGFTMANGLDPIGGGVRCNSTNAFLSDCRLINNVAATGGGIYLGTLSNCVLTGNSAGFGGAGGGAYGSVLYMCALTNNSSGNSGSGGGVCGAILKNCTLTGNQTGGPFSGGTSGGGAYSSTLSNCTLIGNKSIGSGAAGGGAHSSALVDCRLFSNLATFAGGGAQDSRLTNCIISSNEADYSGAGAGYSVLSRCVLSDNYGRYGTRNGGGAASCELRECLLLGNRATFGGGASGGSLHNCTVVANRSTYYGGGVYYSGVNNSIIYYNISGTGPNFYASSLNSSCADTDPGGTGNITNAPVFLNQTGRDLRLQSNSPCINAGHNDYVANTNDLDGNPRIMGGTVDIGAYEFPSPTSLLSYAWAQQNGLPIDGSADHGDPDGDGANNWHEWRADTSPTNAFSVLKMTIITNQGSILNVTWQSVPTRNYWLERATNLSEPSPFISIANGIIGQAGTKTYTDTSATNVGPYLYRVGVQP